MNFLQKDKKLIWLVCLTVFLIWMLRRNWVLVSFAKKSKLPHNCFLNHTVLRKLYHSHLCNSRSVVFPLWRSDCSGTLFIWVHLLWFHKHSKNNSNLHCTAASHLEIRPSLDFLLSNFLKIQKQSWVPRSILCLTLLIIKYSSMSMQTAWCTLLYSAEVFLFWKKMLNTYLILCRVMMCHFP